MKRVYLSPPDICKKEKTSIIQAMNSNWISSVGPDIEKFENNVSKYLGAKQSCAVSSGTAALHLAMKVLNIGKNDIVLCSSFTFIASANIILYENAVPVFIDSDKSSWTLDIHALEKAIRKYRPKALIAVNIYGQSCDYESIRNICKKYSVFIIEDAAESLGSEYRNKKSGTFGDISIISFNGNKIITTSGGGMLVSDNKRYIEKAKFLSTQAREKEIFYEHKELGFNYRMSNILASIGLEQLKKLDSFVAKRRKIFKNYFNAFSEYEGFEFLPEADFVKSNRWLTALNINSKILGFNRNKIINTLEKENIESRPVWKPMHMQPLYKNFKYIKNGGSDVSGSLFKNGICLPSGSSLRSKDQSRIIDIIISLI